MGVFCFYYPKKAYSFGKEMMKKRKLFIIQSLEWATKALVSSCLIQKNKTECGDSVLLENLSKRNTKQVNCFRITSAKVIIIL